MNLTKRNNIVPEDTGEEIEVVEGELIGTETETSIEKPGTSALIQRGTIEFVAAFGSAAIGLFKIFRMFYEKNSSGKTPAKMRRRRRR